MGINGPYPTAGINKSEQYKVSSFNFIENERMYNYIQRGGAVSHEIIKSSSPGIEKKDRLKINTSNFIENERMCDYVQRGGTRQISETIPEVRDIKSKNALSRNDNHNAEPSVSSRPEKMIAVTSEVREEPGTFAPKRYTTTCYFKPKQNPVSYSETVILVLGSNKKHYFDTVLYQTKLVPFRWTETLATVIKPNEQEVSEAHHQAFIEEPKYHYISLEPQQIAAQRLQTQVA